MKKWMFIISSILMLYSCENNGKEIVVYKSNGSVDRTFDVTESTFWDFKNNGDIDSIKLKKQSALELEQIISESKMEEFKSKPFLNPEYSIVYKSNEIDTIYINTTIDQGYSVKNKKSFVNANGMLLEFFKRNDFLTDLTKFKLNK
ncbi:hypothetical protein [uncultured Aquimarina sp.]|uniref:hypothetical protein n=1 Tax=uncultured Aquimarina sp. TaxID=575652 RepID=UPI002637004A|nr:hypothetical protein [uncultured Aquimarina sp.]